MGKNIIVIDFQPLDGWEFPSVLSEETKSTWIIKKCISNTNRFGKIDNFIRYIKYFAYSFHIFFNREKYETILAWQQFNGIIFAFFCRLFHVKKKNKVIIMTFIFKPKKGILGKIYKNFVRYSIDSQYVDKIICFSSSEPAHYAVEFDMNKSKFVYVPLGENLSVDKKCLMSEKKGIISMGLSNRDYDFLIDVFKNLEYELKIYGDKDLEISKNITMTSEYLGEKAAKVINRSMLLVMPLKDVNISSGQLTALHAMQLGVPIIATDADGIRDFVVDGKTGFLLNNDVKTWREKINYLLNNKSVYSEFSAMAMDYYYKSHTVESMARNIGKVVLNKED